LVGAYFLFQKYRDSSELKFKCCGPCGWKTNADSFLQKNLRNSFFNFQLAGSNAAETGLEIELDIHRDCWNGDVYLSYHYRFCYLSVNVCLSPEDDKVNHWSFY